LIAWRIYYDDGGTFSSEEGAPADAPSLGVILIWQAVLNDSHHPAEKHMGLDWYWWRPDLEMWMSGEIHGFLDQAMNLGACHPKFGRVVPGMKYQEILKTANHDLDFWYDPV